MMRTDPVAELNRTERVPTSAINYISIPPIPPRPIPPIPDIGMSSLRSSAIMQSVISISEGIDAAFCNAVRVTLVGSSTPISMTSPYWPVLTLVL